MNLGVRAYDALSILLLRDEKGNFLLIQYSEIYEPWAKVNVKHIKPRVYPKE